MRSCEENPLSPADACEEEMCKRCGRCCHYKTWLEGIPVFTNTACKYLDKSTNLCTVYGDRFDQEDVACLSIREATEQRALPSDCPYVAKIEDYVGPMTVLEAVRILAKKRRFEEDGD